MFNLHLVRNISCSHHLNLHNGKCNNLHGHNYKVEVDIETDNIIDAPVSSDGMVCDFGDVKNIIDSLDHQDLNSYFEEKIKGFDTDNLIATLSTQPTAERLAKWLAIEIFKKVKNTNSFAHKLEVKVTIFETENCSASYTRKGLINEGSKNI